MTSLIDSDSYERVLLTHRPNAQDILDALSLVRQYIIEAAAQCLLTGGMAIDFAMRKHNDRLYDDEKLVDYDMVTDRHMFHACNIAEILITHGISQVNIIRALHPQTLRVRVGGVTVADVTHVPTTVFAKIPYLVTDDGIHFVHPYFQFIDQHSALSLPYENRGAETVFQRWKKDIQRGDMLRKYYKIALKAPSAASYATPTIINAETVRELIGAIPRDAVCMSGLNAFFEWFIKLPLAVRKKHTRINAIATSVPRDGSIVSNIGGVYSSVCVCSTQQPRPSVATVHYKQTIDKIPSKMRIDGVLDVYDTSDRLQTATANDGINAIASHTASLHCVMKEFLWQHVIDGNAFAGYLYSICVEMLQHIDVAQWLVIDVFGTQSVMLQHKLNRIQDTYAVYGKEWAIAHNQFLGTKENPKFSATFPANIFFRAPTDAEKNFQATDDVFMYDGSIIETITNNDVH